MLALTALSEQAGTRALVFTTEHSVDYAVRVLEAGAAGFLPTTSPADELVLAIRTILKGETFISARMAAKVISTFRLASLRKGAANAVKLSAREIQIVNELRTGKTNRQIALALNISEKTVKHYMTLLMEKVQARNRLEVAMRVDVGDSANVNPFKLRRRSTDDI